MQNAKCFFPRIRISSCPKILESSLRNTGNFRQDREDEQDWMQNAKYFFSRIPAFHPVYLLHPVQRIWNRLLEIREILDRIERMNWIGCKYKMLFFRIRISSCSSSLSCPKILPRLFNAIHLSGERAHEWGLSRKLSCCSKMLKSVLPDFKIGKHGFTRRTSAFPALQFLRRISS